ncbi:MAG: hypothetical protein LUH53_00635, partial [Lachnospiraceae bacterium]|nr:hypothetical protein [Lachnospiraceae bacterium]
SYVQKFVYGLCLNCSDDSVTSDVNLRLAILNAIDQDGLITALGGTTQDCIPTRQIIIRIMIM